MKINSNSKYLVIVGGPTASGKTALGIELAKKFKTEIVSADSRQFYKALNIGVARPTKAELQSVKHHFIASHNLTEDLSAGKFAKEAKSVITKLHLTKDVVVVVGGSGLYVKALVDGFHVMESKHELIRTEIQQLYSIKGLAGLQQELNALDSDYFLKLDVQNPQRLMRAIERVRIHGKVHEKLWANEKVNNDYKTIEIAIKHPREVLYERINQRVDQMMLDGFLEEVKSLENYKHLNALKTVGYKELFDYLSNEITLDEAIDKIKQNTRRYAKRQITWINNKTQTTWFAPNSEVEIFDFLTK